MLTRKIDGDSMLFYDGSDLILAIDEEETDAGVLMNLKGELRSEVAHHLQDELDAFTTVGVKVSISFQDVTFITPSVLDALLNAQRRVDSVRKGEILLRNVPDPIYQEMDDAGMTELLMIED